MSELREARRAASITQKQAAQMLGVSLRSYISYENDPAKEHSIKYQYMLDRINTVYKMDEEHGVLSMKQIEEALQTVFSEYPVRYCYLFGSYAKRTAVGTSDVDLLISTDLTGLSFYEMVEKARQTLHKKVDVLDVKQLINNKDLLEEVLKNGIRIYKQ